MTEKNMTLKNGLLITYLDNEQYDKKTLFFAHGWAGDRNNLAAVFLPLQHDYRIISIDLPGFGKSDLPAQKAGSLEYAEYLYQFIQFLDIDSINYIGHSFGGKIGLILAANYQPLVQKLVLINSSGIRAKKTVSWYCKVYLYKLMIRFLKLFLPADKIEQVKNNFGSKDYQNAGPLRPLLNQVVNEDFSYLLKEIVCPVFLYWGENDRDTPLWMAQKMNRLLKDSALYTVKSGSHYSFLDDIKIVTIIKSLVDS